MFLLKNENKNYLFGNYDFFWLLYKKMVLID